MTKSFWSVLVVFHSRTIWYKVFSDKLPLQPLLAKMYSQDPRCVLCLTLELYTLYTCVLRSYWSGNLWWPPTCPSSSWRLKATSTSSFNSAILLLTSLCAAPSHSSRLWSTKSRAIVGTYGVIIYLPCLTPWFNQSTSNSDPSLLVDGPLVSALVPWSSFFNFKLRLFFSRRSVCKIWHKKSSLQKKNLHPLYFFLSINISIALWATRPLHNDLKRWTQGNSPLPRFSTVFSLPWLTITFASLLLFFL